MWPGFGENSRVMEWIFHRTDCPDGNLNLAQTSPIGILPSPDGINLSGLEENVDMKGLFQLPKDFWLDEIEAIRKYFDEQVNEDLPQEVAQELDSLSSRVQEM